MKRRSKKLTIIKRFWQHVVTMFLFSLILLQLWPPTGLNRFFRSVGQDPWSVKKRLQLTRELFDAGQVELAEQELAYLNSNSLLKLAIKFRPDLQHDLQTTKQKLETPKKIQAEIDYWEKILQEKPGYRDGLLRLAILYHQTYEDDKAISAWEEANQLDPNSEEVQKIKNLLNT
ncbi:hypothetical protein KKD62_00990 [Patescibacteria group bacterium]|nr:hypothetical protein [Patescibacteria group bacterium]